MSADVATIVSKAVPETERPDRLRITEIFFSLQGESRSVGCPTVFVRLTGCPLRCSYCDTAYAFSGGEWQSLGDIVAEVGKYNSRYVTVTGGEPMAQRACPALLTALCDAGYEVSLETSGALDLSMVDARVVKIMDLKTPGSGEMGRNHWDNITLLTDRDQLKFVLCDRADYEWSKQMIAQHELASRCELLMSPCFAQLDPKALASWILEDHLPVRFQLQLHKILWGEEQGR
ncbi:MAG: 7-carboxy-7-deazaguanine synthase QueE [Gammaproteobacteria bacterium]|nr:7-carboxy-7-deazaguanine synthase QueE [Gammaproteobacteria bacterium]